jgi:hypothetical protein
MPRLMIPLWAALLVLATLRSHTAHEGGNGLSAEVHRGDDSERGER